MDLVRPSHGLFAFATLISFLYGFNKTITWVIGQEGASIQQDVVLQNECGVCLANQVGVVQYPLLFISSFFVAILVS